MSNTHGKDVSSRSVQLSNREGISDRYGDEELSRAALWHGSPLTTMTTSTNRESRSLPASRASSNGAACEEESSSSSDGSLKRTSVTADDARLLPLGSLTSPTKVENQWRRNGGTTTRSAFGQILVVGMAGFAGPGMFNALLGLGGAGAKDAGFANATNSLLYCTFGVFGFFGGAAYAALGNRLMVILGLVSFAFYVVAQYTAGLYVATGIEASSWMILAGGVLGVGAAWFWTAQGAMTMAYSTPECRGKYISTFWVLFNMGGCIGGLLALAVNFSSSETESANGATYMGITAVMVGGGVMAALCLVTPDQVVRDDGSRVVTSTTKASRSSCVSEEMKGALGAAMDSNMLWLSPLFIVSNLMYTYQFNGVNGQLFTIRSRGLNSALYWGAQMIGSVVLSRVVLDRRGMSCRGRALLGVSTIGIFLIFNFSLGSYLQLGFESGGYDKTRPLIDRIDFSDFSRFMFPCLVFVLYGFSDALIQTYACWIIATLGVGDPKVCANYTGFFKAVQSFAAAAAWALDLAPRNTYTFQFVLCFVLTMISLATTLRFVWTAPQLVDVPFTCRD